MDEINCDHFPIIVILQKGRSNKDKKEEKVKIAGRGGWSIAERV